MPSQLVSNANYYEFTYSDQSAGGWGEVKTVKFPKRFSGASEVGRATVTYGYRWENYPASGGSRDVTLQLENPVVSRTVQYKDGDGVTQTQVSTYSFTGTDSTTTPPNGSGTISRVFAGDVYTPWNWRRGLVATITEQLRRVTTRIWTRNWPYAGPGIQVFDGNAANAYVQSESVAQDGKTRTRNFVYDRNGNVTSLEERDWGTPGTILRTTAHTYVFPTGAPDTNINYRRRSTTHSQKAI
jgi:hypothetical protein